MTMLALILSVVAVVLSVVGLMIALGAAGHCANDRTIMRRAVDVCNAIGSSDPEDVKRAGTRLREAIEENP